MNDCIFCKIVKGDIPSYTIYEDDIVKVFLDINPVSDGHVLIIPKEHTENLESINLDTLNYINKISKDLIIKLKNKLNCSGVTVLQNNGYGQDVKHYHLHLIPRYDNDNLKFYHEDVSDVKKIFEKLI